MLRRVAFAATHVNKIKLRKLTEFASTYVNKIKLRKLTNRTRDR